MHTGFGGASELIIRTCRELPQQPISIITVGRPNGWGSLWASENKGEATEGCALRKPSVQTARIAQMQRAFVCHYRVRLEGKLYQIMEEGSSSPMESSLSPACEFPFSTWNFLQTPLSL